MSTLIGTLVVFHLIGWAIALGGLLSTMKEPKILPGVLHGLYLAVATGLIITGIGGAQDWDLNYIKIGIKLVIALAVLMKRYRFDMTADTNPWPIQRLTTQPRGGLPLRVTVR